MDKLRTTCKIEKIENGYILYYKDSLYDWRQKYFVGLGNIFEFLKEEYYKEYE